MSTGAGWVNAADSTKEVRRTYLQNVGGWRHDIVVVLDASGRLLENVKYLSYGTPFACPAGDTELKGSWSSSDSTRISSYAGSYDIRFDPTHNGVIDAADITYANSIKSGYQTLGLGVLSSTAVANRKGYAGYEHAPELAGTKWHVRNRVLDAELGRWTRRDPLGYVDGMGVYGYLASAAMLATDPLGLHGPWPPRVTNRGCPEGMVYDPVRQQCRPAQPGEPGYEGPTSVDPNPTGPPWPPPQDPAPNPDPEPPNPFPDPRFGRPSSKPCWDRPSVIRHISPIVACIDCCNEPRERCLLDNHCYEQARQAYSECRREGGTFHECYSKGVLELESCAERSGCNGEPNGNGFPGLRDCVAECERRLGGGSHGGM